jgi:hypothetical protein
LPWKWPPGLEKNTNEAPGLEAVAAYATGSLKRGKAEDIRDALAESNPFNQATEAGASLGAAVEALEIDAASPAKAQQAEVANAKAFRKRGRA